MFARHKSNKFNLACNIAYVDLCATYKEAFAVGGVSKKKIRVYICKYLNVILINNLYVVIQFTIIHCGNNCLQKSVYARAQYT